MISFYSYQNQNYRKFRVLKEENAVICCMTCTCLYYTDEEIRRTYLWPFLSELQEPGCVLPEKRKFSMVTFVIKHKIYALEFFLISNISSTIAIHSVGCKRFISLLWVKNPTRPKNRNYMNRGFVGRDIQVLYLQAAFCPSEKDSTTIKKCASMEAMMRSKNGVFDY